MKTSRIITLFLALIAAISAFAQKRLTVINEDAGESFEVTVPDGLKIYQYNENWLDSIPYLMEQVRNREPWAYENLARCYRYGIGVEKCIINALRYYDKAGIDEMELAEKAYEADPADELGFMNHLMENLDKKRMTVEDAMTQIENYPNSKPRWLKLMKTILDNRDVEDLDGYVQSTIDWDTVTGDELVASVACIEILKPNSISLWSKPSSPELMKILSLAANKIPMLYDIVGDRYLELYKDCPSYEEAMKNAFEMYHKAYQYGLLEMIGAIAVLDYRDENMLYEGFPFTQEELANLDSQYSKEYRDHFHSAVEEVVIEEGEWNENPVELIEEE